MCVVRVVEFSWLQNLRASSELAQQGLGIVEGGPSASVKHPGYVAARYAEHLAEQGLDEGAVLSRPVIGDRYWLESTSLQVGSPHRFEARMHGIRVVDDFLEFRADPIPHRVGQGVQDFEPVRDHEVRVALACPCHL